jgi:hypothetical protein
MMPPLAPWTSSDVTAEKGSMAAAEAPAPENAKVLRPNTVPKAIVLNLFDMI